jgi:hypothetical protein
MPFMAARLPIAASTFLILIAACACAQTQAPSPSPEQQSSGAASKPAEATRTGKERLGPKWSDEQRADDCHVPPQKRVDSTRPDCAAPSK